jgi:hypothetical protein
MAPVLPADINASAFPSLRRVSPLTREESFFSRTALTGGSFKDMSSVASIISIWLLS